MKFFEVRFLSRCEVAQTKMSVLCGVDVSAGGIR